MPAFCDEVPGVPLHAVQEVSNYVAAMTHGLERMRGGFPLSLRLIREIHEILLFKGRGSDKRQQTPMGQGIDTAKGAKGQTKGSA